jgi:hypothetical protein
MPARKDTDRNGVKHACNERTPLPEERNDLAWLRKVAALRM